MLSRNNLLERLQKLEIRTSNFDAFYLGTYEEYILFFKRHFFRREIDEHDARIGVMLVYTWMGPAKVDPRCWNAFNGAKETIALVANESLNMESTKIDLKKVDIERLRDFVGGSLIATSKFLHFLAPSQYPIWDSNVALACYGYKYPYEYNQSSDYLRYVSDIRALTLPEGARAAVEACIGDSVSEIRKKEFALFHLGIAEKSGVKKTKQKKQ